MKKIDLHVHTKKIANVDTVNRNIVSAEDCCNQLENANIGIAAITNHNTLDVDQFKELEELCKEKNILLLPGVELDVYVDNNPEKRRQMNVIVEKCDDITNFLNENPNISYVNPINIDIVIEYFNNIRTIFFVDMKSDGQGVAFKEEENKKYFEENKEFKNPYIFDVKEKQHNFFYNYQSTENCPSLLSSDNKEWSDKQYEKKWSKKLCMYEQPILNFRQLYEIAKNKEINMIFKSEPNPKKEFDNFELVNEQNKVISHIKNFYLILEKVNVVFGPKASGKSTLLYSIKKHLEEKEKQKVKFYSYEKNEDDLEKETNVNPEEFPLKEIKEIIKNLINYNDSLEKQENLKKLYDYHNYKYKKSNLTNIDERNIEENKEFNDISKEINCYYKKIDEYAKKNLNDFQFILTENEKITKKLKEVFFEKNKKYFHNCIWNHTVKSIKKILFVNKSEYFEINTFGLYEKYLKRKTFFQYVKKFKDFLNEKRNVKLIKEFDVPQENTNDIKKIYLKEILTSKINSNSTKPLFTTFKKVKDIDEKNSLLMKTLLMISMN